jgi:hypothetical protein
VVYRSLLFMSDVTCSILLGQLSLEVLGTPIQEFSTLLSFHQIE